MPFVEKLLQSNLYENKSLWKHHHKGSSHAFKNGKIFIFLCKRVSAIDEMKLNFFLETKSFQKRFNEIQEKVFRNIFTDFI